MERKGKRTWSYQWALDSPAKVKARSKSGKMGDHPERAKNFRRGTRGGVVKKILRLARN